MLAQMNMNDNVTVRLTERGIKILRERHDELQAWLKERNESHVVKPFVEPENDMYTNQLWTLFQIFGHAFVMGTEVPFYVNVSIRKVECERDKLQQEHETMRNALKFISGQGLGGVYQHAFQVLKQIDKGGKQNENI